MNQVRVYLRMERRGIIGWSASIGGVVLFMGLIYVAFGGAEELQKLVDAYPPELIEAFGGDFTTVGGFLEAEVGTFLPIIFGIYLIMLMTRHFAGSEESGRLDHLMARPISRGSYYWQTLLGAALGFTAIVAAGAVGGVIGFLGEASWSERAGIVGMMLEFWLFGLSFLGLGALLGAAFHHRGPANGIGAGIVAVFFVMDLASRFIEEIDWISYVTPMGYLARSDLYNGEPDLAFFLLSITMAALTAVAGWLVFERKNLYA